MNDVLNYLTGLERFGINLGLERMQQLMRLLDHPEKKFRAIHVTGTNGKGSVCAMIASILRTSGLKVGLYTSPHLVRFNERIVVDRAEITGKELARHAQRIRKAVEQNNISATFFEFTTALAFLHFAENNVDIAVVEVGMGGRLDATNVVNAEIAVITTIGLEHTEYLGDTLEKIADEKCGIIKEKSVVVTGTEGVALDVIRKKSEGHTFFVVNGVLSESIDDSREFSVDGQSYFIPFLGRHQIKNACIAIKVVELLGISYEDIVEGLRDAYWPARLEYLYDNMLIDCAHNVDGVKVLVDYVQHLENRKVLLLGIAQDKNADEMAKMLAPLFEQVIVTEGNFKPMDCFVLAEIVKKYNLQVTAIKDPTIALRAAIDAVSDGKLLLVTGSMYLVGDVLKMMGR